MELFDLLFGKFLGLFQLFLGILDLKDLLAQVFIAVLRIDQVGALFGQIVFQISDFLAMAVSKLTAADRAGDRQD